MRGLVKRLDATMQVYIAAGPNGTAPGYALMFRLTTMVSSSTFAILCLRNNRDEIQG